MDDFVVAPRKIFVEDARDQMLARSPLENATELATESRLLEEVQEPEIVREAFARGAGIDDVVNLLLRRRYSNAPAGQGRIIAPETSDYVSAETFRLRHAGNILAHVQ